MTSHKGDNQGLLLSNVHFSNGEAPAGKLVQCEQSLVVGPSADRLPSCRSTRVAMLRSVLLLGANHQGLGAMQDGDTIYMGVEGVGRFTLSVSDPLKRRWPRGVDEASAKDMREGLAARAAKPEPCLPNNSLHRGTQHRRRGPSPYAQP